MMISRKEALLQLLRHDPSDRRSHYMLGNEYFKVQRYAEAVQTLRRYLHLSGNEGAAYGLLTQSLERLGDLDGARRAYRDGLAAATRHRHQPLIDDYTEALRDLE